MDVEDCAEACLATADCVWFSFGQVSSDLSWAGCKLYDAVKTCPCAGSWACWCAARFCVLVFLVVSGCSLRRSGSLPLPVRYEDNDSGNTERRAES